MAKPPLDNSSSMTHSVESSGETQLNRSARRQPAPPVKSRGLAISALNSLGGLFGYGAEVVAAVPHDLVGVLGGDWLHEVRIRNLAKLRTNPSAF